jgi:hypothetical protein
MAEQNKCDLGYMLQTVLAAANMEQNMLYPPLIYQHHYNIATSFLLDAIAEKWQENIRLLDVGRPFLEHPLIPNKNGFITIPDNCRNFLNAAIFANKNLTGNCGDLPQIILEVEFKNAVNASKCLSRPIDVVPQSEYDLITTHPYNYPTYKYPVGCFLEKNKLKICPYDIPQAEVRYLRNEKSYIYAYTMQPDDTYITDDVNTTPTEWTNAAFPYIFKAVSTLFAIYMRDKEYSEWNMALKQIGLL